MTPNPTEEADTSAEDALKRRLLNRIAIAAVMVVGLLGSLAMFDAINAPAPAPAPAPAEKLAKLAPPVAPPPAPAGGATGAGDKPADAAQPAGVVAAATEPPPVPERTLSPGAPPLLPLPAEKPLTRPATGKPASIRPAEPAPLASAARPDPARELASATAARRAASRPLTQAAGRQYALQMGVFGNVANAEDLRAKLELNGIPSTIEARVHVGPFRSRDEIENVRAKLKELGLDGGLLVTLKGKP